MRAHNAVLGLASVLLGSTLALAQTPTPTPVDSNVAVSSFAQTRGQSWVYQCSDTHAACTTNFDCANFDCAAVSVPCTTRGGKGCGGCYPHGLPTGDPVTDLLAQLNDVNPEWAPIAPMISGMDDASLPPVAAPVVVTGNIRLSKSPGDDFSASHVSADYNAEIVPDNNGRFGTGNTDGKVEYEWEWQKLPMFAWSGEGDRVIAVGRWIFDCGHPDPTNQGTCSNNPAQSCLSSGDCASCSGTCSNNPAQSCTAVQECATCNGVQFAYQAEMHPPQVSVVLRNKFMKAGPGHVVPATQADVYISADGGGAGDRCTVNHLADPGQQLSSAKSCFLHHCSSTTGRQCTTDKDCAPGETCLDFDPRSRLADVNAPNFNQCSTTAKTCSVDTDCPSGETCVHLANFEFDMPLPTPPSGTATLKTKIVKHKPKGGIMPKPILTIPTPPLGPNPTMHVAIPMTVPIGSKLPNVFAGTISAGWVEDTTALTRVKVKLLSLTINNPLKDSAPAIPRQCTNVGTGLSGTPCTTNADCAAVATGTCSVDSAPCQVDADCPSKAESCSGGSECVGGIIPGWDLWSEVNGRWIKFTKLDTLGAAAPFAAPPYVIPSPTPYVIKKTYAFDEYVPADGSIHIKASGHSLNCLKILFGHNLIEGLLRYGFTTGATCLGAVSKGVGQVDVTHAGPDFTAQPAGTTCSAPVKGSTTCTATSVGGEGGTCSITTSQLCATDADCPAKHCSNDATKACTADGDCGTGNTCDPSPETCKGRCSNDGSPCHQNSDCGAGNDCQFGDFTLQYSIQVK